MIITLAGHVDHGKTSLVRALTGVETDRLAEEKRRGLTIDLGFAYLETPQGTLGFVDVPGHHKFIHNMVAGVASRQFALLVIAADDGPMPQSREHLQILELLGLSGGVIALTKADRVSEERLIEARQEIQQLIANSFLNNAQIITTSVETGLGLEQLRQVLSAAQTVTESAPDEPFRLAIDRSFTVTGAGVVVTGTIQSGSVRLDESLRLFPHNNEVRVRSLRAQDKSVDTAGTGERCAINIAGIDIDSVERGQWLTSLNSTGSQQFTLGLQILEDFPRPVRHWLPVHVYHASSHSTGHIALLEEGRLAPGSEETVEVITDEPLLVARGDRLVIRDQGLDRTLGGGAVVAPASIAGRRRSSERLLRLKADQATNADEAFVRHLELGEVDLQRFTEVWRIDDKALDRLLDDNQCRKIELFAVSEQDWQRHLKTLSDSISERHRSDPSLQGIKQSDLMGVVPDSLLPALLLQLVSDRQLENRTGRYLPTSHQVNLSDVEQSLLNKVTRHLDQPQPPSLGDLAKLLRQPIPQLAKGLLPLVAKKQLVRISDSRYYLPARVKPLADLAMTLGGAGPFTVREYRDASGIGRNVAIEVLEYFDSRGFTRRNGDTRSIGGELSRLNLG